MCAVSGWRLRAWGDVREMSVPTWAGSGSRERGQYSNIREGEQHGSSSRHYVTSWRGAVRRRSSSSYCLALNVPYGEQQLPPSVRSFPERPDARLTLWARLGSVMGRVWGAQIITFNVRGFLRLLLDCLGGSFSSYRIWGLESRYSARQINFKQKTDY